MKIINKTKRYSNKIPYYKLIGEENRNRQKRLNGSRTKLKKHHESKNPATKHYKKHTTKLHNTLNTNLNNTQ